MANPSSRQTLIDYCLRKLGFPVLEINIDDDQIEDRIDEALQFYREYHYDAVESVYLKQEITTSELTISGINALSFIAGEKVTGSTSGAYTTIHSIPSANKIKCKDTSGTFISGETLTGSTSSNAATFSSIILGNYDNKYFDITDAVTGIIRVLPFTSRTRGMDLFDTRYQLLMNDLHSLQSVDIIYYSQIKTHLNLINDLLVGQKPIRYNRHQNRLHVDMSWETDVAVGEFMIIECFRILDPSTYTDVYNDYFLKRYATALIKQQWGVNLKKFEGVQLPGGVTLNGQIIYNEATEELDELQKEVQNTFQLPIDFYVG